jgi:hypothetical protein
MVINYHGILRHSSLGFNHAECLAILGLRLDMIMMVVVNTPFEK